MAAKVEKILISPGFPINFWKIHRISKNYLKSSKSYGQKPLGVPEEPPPGLNRLKKQKFNSTLEPEGPLNLNLTSDE